MFKVEPFEAPTVSNLTKLVNAFIAENNIRTFTIQYQVAKIREYAVTHYAIVQYKMDI